MPKYEPIRYAPILALLKDLGPMTKQEIAEQLGLTKKTVDGAINYLRKMRPGASFRIVGWRGTTGRDAGIYAAEDGADETAPPIRRQARRAASRAKYRAKNREAINAKNRVRAAERKGRSLAVNPWMPLAPKAVRFLMTQAANSTLKRAA